MDADSWVVCRVNGDPVQSIKTFQLQVSDSKPSDSVNPSQEIAALDEKVNGVH